MYFIVRSEKLPYNFGVERSPIVTKLVQDQAAYYLIHWSRLAPSDRYRIIATVPSLAGIFELYYQDEASRIHRFMISKAWYGGLRAAIRRCLDAELEVDPVRRRILSERECLYRYSLLESRADMDDILFFFSKTIQPGASRMEPSGRYEEIFVEETSSDKIVTI